MASLDRTSEFFSLCQSLPPSLSQSTGTSTGSNNNNAITSQSAAGRYGKVTANDPNDELRTFHRTASLISKEIHSTSTLLQELTTVIHSRTGSLFVGNDETSKVNNLVLRIKGNVESLNMKLDAANEMIQRNKRRLGRNSQAGMEATNLVGQLQEEFMNTTKGFKDVLQVRSDRIKERSDKESHLLRDDENFEQERVSLLGNKPRVYQNTGPVPLQGVAGGQGLTSFGQSGIGGGIGGDIGSSGLNSFGSGPGNNAMGGPRLDLTSAIMSQANGGQMPGGESTMQLPRPYGIEASRSDDPYNATGMRQRHNSSISNDTSGIPSLPVYTPLDIQQMEEQSGQAQQMQLIPDQTYLRERADAMEAVESNIVELGTIFNKLAVMVNEHSEMVTRVEDNVNDASDNITLSMNTLTDTLDNLRSNRQLFFRLMAVLVIFIIVFITCFA